MTRLVILGEAMLDVDVDGTARRLCPDVPAPVIDDADESRRPGGAALAALLAARSGGEVTLVTPLADDAAGAAVAELLPESVRVVPVPAAGATPVKQRIRADGHVVTRLDRGGRSAPWQVVPGDVGHAVDAADAVLVSDYGRGLTEDPLARRAMAEAAARVPLVWDPHPRGGTPVARTTVSTPNHRELAGFTGESATADVAGIAGRARDWLAELEAEAVATTLGERGALLALRHGPAQVFPTTPAGGGDTCGAGDRFASVVALGLAEARPLPECVQLAVQEASSFVARGGASGALDSLADDRGPTDTGPEDLARRVREGGGTVVATGGCFDLLHAGHVASLEAARSLGDCLVVCLNSDRSVRRLKGDGRPVVSEVDRARVLESLHCVDGVVIFDDDTPERALRTLRPHIWAKGGDYVDRELPERALLEEWGGEVFVLPYLDGRSTTRIVGAIRAADEPRPAPDSEEREVS
jgi:D-beta-D-heptose 7-phosphate kinase / D-beta-D-heptose 1-phosphate adenosyltransferase